MVFRGKDEREIFSYSNTYKHGHYYGSEDTWNTYISHEKWTWGLIKNFIIYQPKKNEEKKTKIKLSDVWLLVICCAGIIMISFGYIAFYCFNLNNGDVRVKLISNC